MKLDGFDILEQLGNGGMATVYRARQISLDREVAIKVFAPRFEPTPEDREQFQQEARIAARLKHPGLVQVYDAIFTNETFCFVMELVRGYTVAAWIERKGRLTESQVLDVADSVAAALDYAWTQHGVIHCDIKPENLMVDEDGTVKILDLGLCKTAQAMIHQQAAEEVYGTPQYLSPEQAIGQSDLDCRTDIYALGATMYHLATGQLLFPGHTDPEVMDLQVRSRAPGAGTVNPSLSAAFCSLVEKMLCKDRDRRQRDWHEVRTDIEAVRMGLPLPSGNPVPGASTVESAPPPAQPRTPAAAGQVGRKGKVRVTTAPRRKFFRPKAVAVAPVVTVSDNSSPLGGSTIPAPSPSGSGHYGLVVLAVIGAAIVAALAANAALGSHRKAQEAARQTALQEMREKVAALAGESANSPAFAAVEADLEQMRTRFPMLGADIDKARQDIQGHRAAAEMARLKGLFDKVVAEANAIARTGDFDRAIALLGGYAGEGSESFAPERERAIESIQENRRVKEAEERRQEEERRSQEAAEAAARAAEQSAGISRQLQDAFEGNGIGYAVSLLEDLETRFPAAFSSPGECATMRDLIRGVKAARDHFESDFRPDSTMTLALRNGTTFRGKLLRFDRNADELVFLSSVNGIEINRTLRLQELAPREILTRLGDGTDIGTRYVRVQLFRRYDLPLPSTYYLDEQTRDFPPRIKAAALGR